MSCQPDAQSMPGVAVEAIGKQDAGVTLAVPVGPQDPGQADEGTGLQQSRGNHQIIAGMEERARARCF